MTTEPMTTAKLVEDLADMLERAQWLGISYARHDYNEDCCPECEAPSYTNPLGYSTRQRLDDPQLKESCPLVALLLSARAFVNAERETESRKREPITMHYMKPPRHRYARVQREGEGHFALVRIQDGNDDDA